MTMSSLPPTEFRIQLLCSWEGREALFRRLKKQSQDGEGRWENIQFTDSSIDIDYYVAINSPILHDGELQPHVPERTVIWNVEHEQADWQKEFSYRAIGATAPYIQLVTLDDRINWC